MDDIFKQMNIANSSAGQEYLYRLLRTPAESPDRLREIDSLAEYFAAHEKERIALQQEFVKLGFVKYLSLSDYIGLMVGMEPGGNSVHIAALIALAACFCGLLCGKSGYRNRTDCGGGYIFDSDIL